FWWNTVALPILSFMRRANYPEDAVQAYTLFFRNEIVPLLSPCLTPLYPSWMTDDHTPVEFSLILGETTKSSVRFTVEPTALARAGDRSTATLRRTLERLSSHLGMKPQFDLEWFDICGEELLVTEAQPESAKDANQPIDDIFLGFDCAHSSVTAKAYFMPRIRPRVFKESTLGMMDRLTSRMGLATPWAQVSHFLARFLPGDCPEIEIVAVDCVPGTQNRLKIYFRADILSCAHMEYFLTLGGALSHAGVRAGMHNAQMMWGALTQATAPPTQAPYFPGGLIYYELKQGDDIPSAKVYLPVQRYLENDLEVARGVERLAAGLPRASMAGGYSDFIQAIFPHRDLSSRTGIHTYVACTVKPGGSDISVYYNPEAFAPER
ncbi:aromatic prenyltransferase, partial [Mycena latifolia]